MSTTFCGPHLSSMHVRIPAECTCASQQIARAHLSRMHVRITPPHTSTQAHAGGFAALDARGELVATAGYVSRMGRLALDTYAKVGGGMCL